MWVVPDQKKRQAVIYGLYLFVFMSGFFILIFKSTESIFRSIMLLFLA